MTDLNPFTSPVSGVRQHGSFPAWLPSRGRCHRRCSRRREPARRLRRRQSEASAARRATTRRSSTSRTGRSTSTPSGSTVTKTYPTLEGFEQETGDQGQLHRAGQRQRGVLRQDPPDPRRRQGCRRRLVRAHRLDGLQADQPQLAGEDRQGEHPELRQPDEHAEVADLRPEPRLLSPVAVRCHRYRLRREQDRRQCTSITDLFTNPDLNGQVTALKEMRDTMGLILLDQGHDPADFTEEEWASAIAALPGGQGLRPDPSVHRQQLRPAAGPGHDRGLHGVVRRRHPAAVRQRRTSSSSSRRPAACSGRTTC